MLSFGILFAYHAHAKILADLPLPVVEGIVDREEDHDNYVPPNETEPQDAIPIVTKAPTGVYVAVGTERGFISSALAKNVGYLLLLDFEPRVVLYNQLNIALLQMSIDMNDYKHLRLAPSFTDWEQRVAQSPTTVENYLKPLLTLPNFTFFQKVQNEQIFKLFNGEIEGTGEFKGANYLFDPKLFSRIQGMAKNGRIESTGADLNQNSIDMVVDGVASKGLKISVLDLSNCWWPSYVREEGLTNTITQFAHRSSPGAILLLTEIKCRFSLGGLPRDCKKYENYVGSEFWSYYGFKLSSFLDRSFTKQWVAQIQRSDPRHGTTDTLHNIYGIKGQIVAPKINRPQAR